jgi:hypothetical protein
MTSVEVFVDDAVRGRLPYVCAKTGVPAEGKLTVEHSTGGIGFAWLLIFLGPFGWLLLLGIVIGAARLDRFTVRLPYSERAVEYESLLRRARLAAGVATVGFALLATIAQWPTGLRVAFALAAFVFGAVAIVMQVRLWRAQVAVHLDASRRWVRRSRVHPNFVRAVEARDAENTAPRSQRAHFKK